MIKLIKRMSDSLLYPYPSVCHKGNLKKKKIDLRITELTMDLDSCKLMYLNAKENFTSIFLDLFKHEVTGSLFSPVQ